MASTLINNANNDSVYTTYTGRCKRYSTFIILLPNHRFTSQMKPAIWCSFVFMAYLHAAIGCDVEMVGRAEWGARPPSVQEEYMQMPVPHIFIHHTAMGACNTTDSCSRIMRGIQNFHMDDNGWDDIGYNFLIGGDGKVYVARGWERVGAHTYGFNRIAVALSLMGNFVQDPPPDIMLDTTKKMIECAREMNYTTEDFRIHGHRDGGCTECPGQALYDIIKTWDRFEAGPLPGYQCRRRT